jgi:hypothetical protein
MNSDDIIAFVLQNLVDLEKVRGPCSEMCPAFSSDESQAVSIKAEVFSDSEEEYPVRITVPGIKAEPKVSCVSIGWISQIQVSLVL